MPQATMKSAQSAPATQTPPTDLATAYTAVRQASMAIREPLSNEDCQVQSMADASPIKWHLAHTTWFFEEFILNRFLAGYHPHHPQFGFLFNSYYNAIGPRHERPKRGLVTRPSMDEVEQYRRTVDEQMLDLLERAGDPSQELRSLMALGLNHEQQHQELMLTDIKHALWCNPLRPAYIERPAAQNAPAQEARRLQWCAFEEGLRWIGHEGDGFSYDNERPRHRVFLDAFELASRPVTNAEFLEFIQAGGYADPRWWLDEGWTTIHKERWNAPLYWEKDGNTWRHFTLSGMQDLAPDQPLCHVSYYEAAAYARWAGARLPREQEWEAASERVPLRGNFAESRHNAPRPAPIAEIGTPASLFGDVWEWTASPYVGYPGYCAAEGAVGEYNGKFMCNQWVLRGGSCATPQSHMRSTYRNFFSAAARWQFSGMRLARDTS